MALPPSPTASTAQPEPRPFVPISNSLLSAEEQLHKARHTGESKVGEQGRRLFVNRTSDCAFSRHVRSCRYFWVFLRGSIRPSDDVPGVPAYLQTPESASLGPAFISFIGLKNRSRIPATALGWVRSRDWG
jgi:hypothetical protein